MHLPSSLRHSGLATLLLIVAPAGRAAGQESPSLRPGDRVEVRIVAPAAAITDVPCAAFVADAQRDTLRLDRSDRCPRGAYLADIRVARPGGGSRLTHTVLGTLFGAVVGGVIASAGSGSGCRTDLCNPADGRYAAGAKATAGVVTGAVVGGLLGLALPAGARWVDAGRARPVLVSSLGLRPGLEVSGRMRGPTIEAR